MVTSRLQGSVYLVSSFESTLCTLAVWVPNAATAEKVPELFFHLVDRGDLDGSTPVAANHMAMTVAPEVVQRGTSFILTMSFVPESRYACTMVGWLRACNRYVQGLLFFAI
jgi:hypothetical protein